MNPINLLATAVMLAYSAYLDFKTREVPDRLWIGFSGLALVLLASETLPQFQPTETLYEFISIGLVSVIAYALYTFGFFGGADAKALVAIALFFPIYPGPTRIHPIASLIVLTNGVLVSIALPIAYFTYNGIRILRREPIFRGFEQESLPRKFLAALLGTRVAQVKESQFRFPLEKPTATGKTFNFSLLGDIDFIKNGAHVWVTPGIPLLIFLTLGFFLMVFAGDLLYYLFRLIFPTFHA